MSGLTGRRRYRVGGWRRDKLILQVQFRDRVWCGPEGMPVVLWRDATVEDLIIIEAVHVPHPVEGRAA